MRELKFVAEESTASSLVFRADDEGFFVEVTDELRQLIDASPPKHPPQRTPRNPSPSRPLSRSLWRKNRHPARSIRASPRR